MAKYGQKVITVNVDCNTTQAEEKVRNLAQSVKRVERDGRINLDAVINTSSLKKLDTLVGNKEVNIDFKVKNLSELEKAYEKFNKFPNISDSVLKQLDFAKADIKDKAINKIQQEYQHLNEKTTEDIYNKLSKKLYNPQYNERGDLSDLYKNEVKALVDMYASAQGDFDKTFQTRNRKKTFRQFFNSVKKDFKLRDDTIYKQMMEDFNNDYGKQSAELLKLSSSFKNMSYKDLEKFLQLPKYDYDSIKKFYDSAMAGTLDEHLKVEPEIETATIKSQVENAVANVKANINVDSDSVQAVKSELADIDTHLNVDDDINKVKESLSDIPTHLDIDDDIAKIETDASHLLGNNGVKSSGEQSNKKNNGLLQDQNIEVKINVIPPIESIKERIDSLQNKTIKVKIDPGDSLKNLKQLTQGLNDYDLQGTIKNLKSIGQSFNYAFKNVNQAANAPMKILKDMNNEVLRLKKNLNEVGVKKFSDSKIMNKQLESYKKQAVTEAKNAANETLKEAKQIFNEVEKTKKRNENLESKAKNESSGTWTETQAKRIKKADRILKDYDDNAENLISGVKDKLDLKREDAGKILEKFRDVTNEKNIKQIGDDFTKTEKAELAQLNEYLDDILDYKLAKNKIVNENGKLLNTQAIFENEYGDATQVEKINAVTEAIKAQGIELKSIRKVKSKKDMYDYTYLDGENEITERAYLEKAKNNSHKANVRTSVLTVEEYKTAGERWLAGFKTKFKNLAQYIAGAEIQNQILAQVKQGISFVKEYDSALTNIGMTMQATQGQLQNLGKEAISTGQELGTSATDVIDAAKIYANANETTETVLKKSQATIKLKNASGQDISTVADQVQGVNDSSYVQ